MGDNEQALRQKATLLIAREREVLALRRKQTALGLWLAVAQGLAELIDPKAELVEVCKRVSARLIGVLKLQRALFFEMPTPLSLRPLDPSGAELVELDPAAADLLSGRAGACAEPSGPALVGLSSAVGLHRFLWFRMAAADARPVLFVVGFDRERSAFHEPFDADDLAHFTNTAHQLELLLGNGNLLRALDRDNVQLQAFNTELERRVEERTSALASANKQLADALEVVSRKDARLEADIERARQFQASLLPVLPRSQHVEFAAHYRPLERVGGDIYDVHQLATNQFRIFLADATGHGVQAAMRTILIKAEYDRLKGTHAAPNTLLDALGLKLWSLFPAGDVMTTACCLDLVLDDDGAVVVYANGGNPALVVWQGGRPDKIDGDGPFLGIEAAPFPPPRTFRLGRGDMIFAFTDGLLEQVDETATFFEDRFDLSGCPTDSAQSGVQWLARSFDAFRGECPVSDDVTLIGLRLTA